MNALQQYLQHFKKLNSASLNGVKAPHQPFSQQRLSTGTLRFDSLKFIYATFSMTLFLLYFTFLIFNNACKENPKNIFNIAI